MGYTKLFSSLIHSTIWRADDHVRLVWITMLAISDKDGVVEASVPGLADAARVSVEQCEDALRQLAEPDPYSRTTDHEGRRIEPLPDEGAWFVLNHGKYKHMASEEERREKARIRKQRQRARERKAQESRENAGQSQPPVTCPEKSRESLHTDADTDTDTDEDRDLTREPSTKPSTRARARDPEPLDETRLLSLPLEDLTDRAAALGVSQRDLDKAHGLRGKRARQYLAKAITNATAKVNGVAIVEAESAAEQAERAMFEEWADNPDLDALVGAVGRAQPRKAKSTVELEAEAERQRAALRAILDKEAG